MGPSGATTENDFTPAAQTAAAEAAVELTASNMENGGHSTFSANGAKAAANAELDEENLKEGKRKVGHCRESGAQRFQWNVIGAFIGAVEVAPTYLEV